jgi:hypothetical protein
MRISRPRQDPADALPAIFGIGLRGRRDPLQAHDGQDDDFNPAAGLELVARRRPAVPLGLTATADDVHEVLVVQGPQLEGFGVAHH